ncbi:hydantoinase B/oxoprolinase family protein [Xanthobacter dioxanivorans]|uniref:Hydantoinase B/oxoprolinase family protein n=1 Tax=Xanthobacter dioxanivorans TaxID=2528964 RepID=A0A974PLZ3_9HYPH|nr:hydantoinase B/oxoprolinase family protein [Xanthobacter dioxanivorans]QRG06058.1 hydantoinase B/oxoprolinase family protein [Xanthobacter dioxanivorans]
MHQTVDRPAPAANAKKVDAVTLSVFWNRLLAITEEMGSTLRRTAFSDAVREGDDFSTGLFDAKARLIAQGNFTPGHTGAMPSVVKTMLKLFPPETLKPGDAMLSNDSFIGSGHFPDIFLVTPIFRGQEIIGYCVAIAHHVDVGGYAPGSQEVAGVTSAVQEGLRILPVKVIRQGEFDADILRLICGNVRVPEKLMGDLKAQRNANYVGAQRLLEVHEGYGTDVVEAAVEEILAKSEARMREIIGALPDGTYDFEDWLDDSGPGSPPIRVHVEIRIKGDGMEIDFSGSGDQVQAGINSYINYTRAYATFAAKVLMDALLPQNDGASRPITVMAREGSFFNPVYPAPSGGRAAVQIRIFEATNGALAKVLPHKTMGAHAHWSNPNISGIDDRTGRQFLQYDLIFGGLGALSYKDGCEAMSPVMNCSNIPIEILEANSPVLFRHLGFIADSPGPGTYRGGCAMRKDIEIVNSRALVTLLGDRHARGPYGIHGGKSGGLATTTLIRDGEEIPLQSKESRWLKRGTW